MTAHKLNHSIKASHRSVNHEQLTHVSKIVWSRGVISVVMAKLGRLENISIKTY